MNNPTQACGRSGATRIVVGFAALVLLPSTALAVGQPIEIRVAYLDPGTGSLIIQAVVAALAGAAVAITTYWHKIKSFFGRGSRDSDTSDTSPSDD